MLVIVVVLEEKLDQLEKIQNEYLDDINLIK
jgi:hypothetical protein